MANLKDFFMKTAFLLSQESKCVSHKVGSLIVKDSRIISIGYNGTPSGTINCNDVFNEDKFDRDEHHKWSNKHEIHAEINSLMYSYKTQADITDADMFVTLSPCDYCLKNLTQSGIKNIYYFYKYGKSSLSETILAKINVIQYHSDEVEDFIKRNNIVTKK